MDAFEGLLYANDEQVEHLDLLKVHHSPRHPAISSSAGRQPASTTIAMSCFSGTLGWHGCRVRTSASNGF